MSITVNGTNGLTFNDASTQNTAATGFGFKNRIINGAMVIDQRNAGAASPIPVSVGSGYTLDRWRYAASALAKFTLQQNQGSVTRPVGFSSYLGVTSSAATSLASTDFYILQQLVEGFNTADLSWGTASALTATLSFRVYSSLTGTFGGSISNSGNTRSYPFTYAVPVANTWTTVSVTIPGDTSGAWLTDNGVGIVLIFGLGVGSTLSGTAGAWAGANYLSATGAVSVVGTSGATFYITGVQLEKGSTATSFDYRPYGTELALCQRYCLYEPFFQVPPVTSLVGVNYALKVTMRATPTATFTTNNSTPSIGAASISNVVIGSAGGSTTVASNCTALFIAEL